MIFVECYPDEALVRVLGIPRNEIKHAKSKGNVCKKLSKERGCLGMVDEDPTSSQPSYLRKYQTQWRRNEVMLLFDRSTNNSVIVICPRLEEWILKAAEGCKAKLEDYGLPSNPQQLHKTIGANTDNFKELVEAIKAKSQRIKTLAEVLRV